MILFLNPCTDPARNLAIEEFLLTRRAHDCVMVWRNRPSVVVGRNQNINAQTGQGFLHRHHIPGLRRISGGGAVYQDLGNINFTIIRSAETLRIDYPALLAPVIAILKEMGIDARPDGRSDLVAWGGKISGNAMHIRQGRLLHHGTLLFDADLSALRQALASTPGRYRDKSVDSVRRPVVNLRPMMESPLSAEAFMERLMSLFQRRHPDARRMALSPGDQEAVEEIRLHKYASWEWNWGRSPDYRFENGIDTPDGRLAIRLSVSRGVIKEVRVDAPAAATLTASRLSAALKGARHYRPDLEHALSRLFPATPALCRTLTAELF